MSEAVALPVAAPAVYSPSELATLYHSELDAIATLRATGRARGPMTGLRQLDKLLGGYLPPGLYVIHGEPGSGKSALAWQIAADCGAAAMYVTTEMSPLELTRRHIARTSRKPRRSLLDGNYRMTEEKAMADFAMREGCPYVVDACAIPATAEVISRWLQMLPPLMRSEHVLCVIDSLHSWVAPLAASENLTEYDALNQGIMALREMVSVYNATIIMLSERNRMAMQRGGMSAGAGSRRIEYGADVLMELSRDEKERNSSSQSGVERIDLRLTKNRLGPAGATVALTFMGDTMDFAEVQLAGGYA